MRHAIIVLIGPAITVAGLAVPAAAADRDWALTLRAGVASDFGMTEQEGWQRTPEDTQQDGALTMYPFDFTDGPLVGIAIKHRLCKNLWLEGDYRLRRIKNTSETFWSNQDHLVRHDVNFDSKIFANSLTANLLYEIPVSMSFTPYIKGGFGVGFHVISSDTPHVDGPRIRDSDFKLIGSTAVEIHPAWSIGMGINYKISERISLNVDAQYIDLGKLYADIQAKVNRHKYINTYDRAPETDLKFIDLTAGLTFAF